MLIVIGILVVSTLNMFTSHTRVTKYYHALRSSQGDGSEEISNKHGRNRGHLHIPMLREFVIHDSPENKKTPDITKSSETLPDQTGHKSMPTVADTAVSKGQDGSGRVPPRATNVYGRRWLPKEKTPALIGSSPARISCDVDVDGLQLAYWNNPQGIRDRNFVSPFRSEEKNGKSKYITFESDHGGWNNVRMALEIVFIIAAATGRTLVMPPDQNLYLLRADKNKIQRGFGDFYPLDSPGLKKIVPIISTEEFLRREGGSNGQFPIPADSREKVLKAQSYCQNREKSNKACHPLWYYLREVGYDTKINGGTCFIFDSPAENTDYVPMRAQIDKICKKRTILHYDKKIEDAPLLHFAAKKGSDRLLNHFYASIFFTDPMIDNHYKRFVRDHLHYRESVFCAAGKIIKSLQEEGHKLGFAPDEYGAGGFSSLHVRRGELQFQEVKIPAEEWLENTEDIWLKKELLYIATDEKDKSFFAPLKKQYTIKFLSDYYELAGLSGVDPNHFGMLDTVVASRGRAFAGTYMSTFTGFITRMRGYHGMLPKASWYGMKKQKYILHQWNDPKSPFFSKECPVGWVGIDGDEAVAEYPQV